MNGCGGGRRKGCVVSMCCEDVSLGCVDRRSCRCGGGSASGARGAREGEARWGLDRWDGGGSDGGGVLVAAVLLFMWRYGAAVR